MSVIAESRANSELCDVNAKFFLFLNRKSTAVCIYRGIGIATRPYTPGGHRRYGVNGDTKTKKKIERNGTEERET